MKPLVIAAVTLSASLAGTAARAAEYTLIVQERALTVSADEAWKNLWPFCASVTKRGLDCDIISGDGDEIGSVRLIDHGVATEILVAKSKYSFAFAYPAPNPTAYHGMIEVVPEGPQKSKLVRRMLYDAAPLGTAEAKAADKAARTKSLTGITDQTARVAEGKKP